MKYEMNETYVNGVDMGKLGAWIDKDEFSKWIKEQVNIDIGMQMIVPVCLPIALVCFSWLESGTSTIVTAVLVGGGWVAVMRLVDTIGCIFLKPAMPAGPAAAVIIISAWVLSLCLIWYGHKYNLIDFAALLAKKH
jgi:hypothetical protein